MAKKQQKTSKKTPKSAAKPPKKAAKAPKKPAKPAKPAAKPAISPADMADKRRHLSLLTRLRAGEVLSAAESKDLATLGKLWGQQADKAKASPSPRKKLQITIANVKHLAFDCKDLTAAAMAVTGNLIDRLKRSKSLRDAWDRGRFLRDISALAAVGLTKAEVATSKDIPLAEFERLLADPEAADIWTRAQIETLARLKRGLFESAMAGKGPAIKRFERILQEDRPSSAIDIYRMTTEQMCVIADVTRQTLHTWVTKYGLSRNADATFDLRVFVKWFEGFSQRKVNVTPQIKSEDSLKQVKTERLRIELDLERGKVVDRDAVVAGYVGRLQQFLGLWDRLVDGVCDKCSNMPKQGVAEILGKFKDELRGEFCKVDIEMKLTDRQQKQLEDLLKELE